MNFKNDKYLISELLFKLDLDYNESLASNMEEILNYSTNRTFSEFKYKNLEFRIEITEGSLKSRILIYGTIIIQSLSNYGSLRQGIELAYDDCKWLSRKILEVAKDNSDLIDRKTLREAIYGTGLIGRLNNILSEIEILYNGDNFNREQKIDLLLQDLSDILFVLNESERNAILESLPSELRNQLPKPNQERTISIRNTYFLKPEDNNRENKNRS